MLREKRNVVISIVPVTLVHIQLTEISIVSWETVTGKLTNPVLTCSSVTTGLVSTLIDVGVTSLPLPAGVTLTRPVVDLIPAPASVTAGILTISSTIL